MIRRNYRLPLTYRLGEPGSGCFLAPPDHPSYFVQPVFTRCGDTPAKGPAYYLDGTGYDRHEEFEGLFKPLPLDSERVQLWIQNVFRHMHHCYVNDVIWPVPDWKLRRFLDDVRFSEEWRTREKAAVEQENHEIIERARRIATPDNHLGTRHVRRYYPEFEPTQQMIDGPFPPISDWWATLSEQPDPDSCPGETWKAHPVNGTWCQVCGWREGGV